MSNSMMSPVEQPPLDATVTKIVVSSHKNKQRCGFYDTELWREDIRRAILEYAEAVAADRIAELEAPALPEDVQDALNWLKKLEDDVRSNVAHINSLSTQRVLNADIQTAPLKSLAAMLTKLAQQNTACHAFGVTVVPSKESIATLPDGIRDYITELLQTSETIGIYHEMLDKKLTTLAAEVYGLKAKSQLDKLTREANR